MQRTKAAREEAKWIHSRLKLPRWIKTAMPHPKSNLIKGNDSWVGSTNLDQPLQIPKWECRGDWSYGPAITDISAVQKFETSSKIIFFKACDIINETMESGLNIKIQERVDHHYKWVHWMLLGASWDLTCDHQLGEDFIV